MNENILNLVKQFASDAIVNNPEVPNEKTDTAIQSVSQGIFNGLQNEAAGGGLGQIINMFKPSGGVSNSLSQNIQNSVISSLMDKAGIKSAAAKGIASTIVPLVLSTLSKLGKNRQGDGNGMNVQSLLNTLTGGKTNGMDIQSMLNKNLGGSDGKFDLSDVADMLTKRG